MILLVVILVSVQGSSQQTEQEPEFRERFGIGPDAAFWWPTIHGVMRVDGSSSAGTGLDLHRDAGLPDRAAIPIYGGGTFYIPLTQDKRNAPSEFLLRAEYWAHSWSGDSVLSTATTFGDTKFAAKTPIHSRLEIVSLDLEAAIPFETTDHLFRFDAGLTLRWASGELKLSSPAASQSETAGDLMWGGALRAEVWPLPFLFAGGSVKGDFNFGSAFETGLADLEAYGGGAWGPIRLEGGLRSTFFSQDISDRHLKFSLVGLYIGASAVIRF